MIKNFRKFDRLFFGDKIRIKTKLSVMYAKHAAVSGSIYFGSVSSFAGSEMKQKWRKP